MNSTKNKFFFFNQSTKNKLQNQISFNFHHFPNGPLLSFITIIRIQHSISLLFSETESNWFFFFTIFYIFHEVVSKIYLYNLLIIVIRVAVNITHIQIDDNKEQLLDTK